MDIGKLELFERLKIFVRTSDVLHGYTKARVIRTAQNLSLVQLTADFLHGYTSRAHGW